MGGLGLMFRRRAIQAHPTIEGGKYILAQGIGDQEAFRIMMEKGISSDGVGITKDDAAQITDISTWFKQNTIIRNLDVLEYFTNVTTLSKEAFLGCSALANVFLGHITSTGVDAFKQSGIQKVNAPLLSVVNKYVFTETPALMSAELPLCTTIDAGGFWSSTSLQSIVCPNVTSIGLNGLKSTNISEIELPKIVSLGVDALNLCRALEIVDLGESITSLGNYSFGNTSALKTLVVRAKTPPTLGRGVFEGSSIGNGSIYVPDESVSTYKASSWSGYASIIKPLSEYQG